MWFWDAFTPKEVLNDLWLSMAMAALVFFALQFLQRVSLVVGILFGATFVNVIVAASITPMVGILFGATFVNVIVAASITPMVVDMQSRRVPLRAALQLGDHVMFSHALVQGMLAIAWFVVAVAAAVRTYDRRSYGQRELREWAPVAAYLSVAALSTYALRAYMDRYTVFYDLLTAKSQSPGSMSRAEAWTWLGLTAACLVTGLVLHLYRPRPFPWQRYTTQQRMGYVRLDDRPNVRRNTPATPKKRRPPFWYYLQFAAALAPGCVMPPYQPPEAFMPEEKEVA